MKSLLKNVKEGPKGPVELTLTIVISAFFLAYPFLIYFGLHYFQPRSIYIIVGVLLGLRGLFVFKYITVERIMRLLTPILLILLLVGVGAYVNDHYFLLLLPGLMTLAMGVVFIWSLFTNRSFIETFARSIEEDLPERFIGYCRRVTFLWSVFFILNAVLIFWLTFFKDLTYWTIYTGFVSYCLMGFLMGAEYIYRQWRFRCYGGNILNDFFKWLFPPRGNITPDFIRLSDIMILGRKPGDQICRDGEDFRSWEDFETRVREFTTILNNHSGGRWLIACDDCYAFLVGLFSIWQSESIAVLPPNYQPGSIRESADDVSGVVADREIELGSIPVFNPLKAGEKQAKMRNVKLEEPVAELYTSGTTGEKKRVVKTLSQLQTEVRTLEQTWRTEVEGCDIFATVSHQHIYGLLFRGLWPLAANRSFDRYSRLLPEELNNRMASSDNVVLVTSPAHLKRLVNYDFPDWIRDKIKVIFSSGGRLDRSVAKTAEDRLGCLPYEVLGSTETGGIAWRQQSEESLWKPLDEVNIRCSDRGTLEVKSSFVSSKGDRWHDTGDYVKIKSNGRFFLGERADRVVNVAEKRVSLPEVEQRVEEHENVETASATVLEVGSTPKRRNIVVVAVKPSGRLSNPDDFKKSLRHHLKPHFDSVTLPKRWKFVDEIPRNAQGKIPMKDLRLLFTDHNEGS